MRKNSNGRQEEEKVPMECKQKGHYFRGTGTSVFHAKNKFRLYYSLIMQWQHSCAMDVV